MPTRSGQSYLLDESSESDNCDMDSVLQQTLADLVAQVAALRTETTATNDRLTRLEAIREAAAVREEIRVPVQQYHRRAERNDPDPDEQYVKSVKIDAPTFDGSLEPQLFLDWLQQMDRYFSWYTMPEERKVKL